MNSDSEAVAFDAKSTAESSGLVYARHPVQNISDINLSMIDNVNAMIDGLPKPVFVECLRGRCASLVVLLRMGGCSGASALEVMRLGVQLGFNYAASPQLYTFVNDYLDREKMRRPFAVVAPPGTGGVAGTTTVRDGTPADAGRVPPRTRTAESRSSIPPSKLTTDGTSFPLLSEAAMDREDEDFSLGRMLVPCAALSAELSVAAHFEIGDIPAIARDFRTEGSEGYRTIINLACDTELRAGEPSHAEEEAACRAAGIDWVHLPVASLCAIDGPCAVAFFRTIDAVLTPVLVHCGARSGGRRPAFLSALYLVLRQQRAAAAADAAAPPAASAEVIRMTAALGLALHNHAGVGAFAGALLRQLRADEGCREAGSNRLFSRAVAGLRVGREGLLRLPESSKAALRAARAAKGYGGGEGGGGEGIGATVAAAQAAEGSASQ